MEAKPRAKKITTTDPRMDAFEERIKQKEDKPRPEALDFPITTQMKEAMEREFQLNQKCPNCKHYNKPKDHIIFTMRFDILGEQVPLIMWVCNQCGITFAPKWGRRIVQAGMKKQMELHGKVEIDG